jgi:hypothetical protein
MIVHTTQQFGVNHNQQDNPWVPRGRPMVCLI